jgi:hypothetical protein
MRVSFMTPSYAVAARMSDPTVFSVTVLVARAVLTAADRWWSGTGRDRGLDKAQVYDLVTAAAGEIEAVWGALEPESDGSRVFKSRSDDTRLPALALQVFEIAHSSELVQPGDLLSFLVAWDVRFWF